MRVACPDCGAGISFGYLNERWDKLTEEQAKEAIRATISAWNRRAQPANEPLTLKQPEVVRCKDCKYRTDIMPRGDGYRIEDPRPQEAAQAGEGKRDGT